MLSIVRYLLQHLNIDDITALKCLNERISKEIETNYKYTRYHKLETQLLKSRTNK